MVPVLSSYLPDSKEECLDIAASFSPPQIASIRMNPNLIKTKRQAPRIYYILCIYLSLNLVLNIMLPLSNPMRPGGGGQIAMHLTASAFSVGRFGWPGLEWREIIDWWTSGYSRGVVIGRGYIPPCKLCDMPRMFRVD